MKTLIILSLMILASCGKNGSSKNETVPYYDFTQMHTLDGRDTILVVGDSISMGYTPYLVQLFPDMQVLHNVDNARHSQNGRDNIDAWIAHAGHYNVCILNHGNHDVRPVNAIPVANYEANIAYEANALLNACDKVIWMSTTWTPTNMPVDQYPTGSVVTYNAAAEVVMNTLGVSVCDLHAKSETIKNLYKKANTMDNVHFIPAGYKILSETVRDCINTL